jgi:hypothetical protein
MIVEEQSPARETEIRIPEPDVAGANSFGEKWLHEHLNVVVFGVIIAGFLVRVENAYWNFLNPDEAIHYIILHQPSAFSTYKSSLTNAHPPLIYLILHFWSFLGRSELMLRFPSVLAGTALCWVAYKWIRQVFGKTAGVIGLIFVAFSPALIALSAEVRSYALLLFFETAALYFLEIAFQEMSVRKMVFSFICLYLAILSHYSSLFLAFGVGIYALVRIAESKLPRKTVIAWCAGQAGTLALFGFLYVTHISKVQHYFPTWAMPFEQSYFHPDRENLLSFAWERTLDIFLFLFQNQYIARGLILLWAAAVAFLLFRELVSGGGKVPARHLGLLLLLPVLTVFVAGISRFYPYVGERHTVFLAPFIIAALSFAVASVFRQKLWAVITIAVLLMGASNSSGITFGQHIPRENQNRRLMEAAVTHIRQTISPDDVILADYESAIELMYYFCGPKMIVPLSAFDLRESTIRCNGHSIATFQAWSLKPAFFLDNFGKMMQAQGIKPGARVWVFEAGWDVTLDWKLKIASQRFRCITAKAFQPSIALIPFDVGPDLSPLPTVTNCSAPALNTPAD